VTYLAEESSVESGRPIELYEITLGTTTYRWTSGGQNVEVAGYNWIAVPGSISRSDVTVGLETRTAVMVVTVRGDNPFCQLFTTNAPSEMPELKIHSVHWGDIGDVVTLWEGEISEIEWINDTAEARIIARTFDGALDTPTPRHDAGILCTAMLYDGLCQVARSSHQFDGTASSVSGDTLVVSGLDTSKGVGWATAGEIIFGDERRIILDHSATDTLTLGSPFLEDPTGESVTVHAGCAHTIQVCNTKFSNKVNFQGKPYVPLRDVHRDGIS
jgi:uncharacterized phage protein (TIGR02218 family)